MNDTTCTSAEFSEMITGREKTIVQVTYLLSFISGAAALIYQVTWVKMLSLSFGSTTMAAGAVIGSFMAGMGIGARLYDVVYRRLHHAFRLYAILELGIATTAFLITLTLYFLPQFYAGLHQSLASNTWQLSIARFVSVFLLLLAPASLMGATFPALCTALIRSAKGVERHLGMVYGLNTLGAAAGALIAGFVLIELMGNQATTWFANSLNILVAIGALWLWKQVRETTLDEVLPAQDTELKQELPRILVAAVLLGSGFATMSYEVFWIRALKYIVGNSTYAVSMVLIIFLVGLGIGGVAYRKIIARRSPGLDLAKCQLLIAVLALIAVGIEALLLTQNWFANFVSIFSPSVQSLTWISRIVLAGMVSVLLLLLPTIIMGLSFPLCSHLYIEKVSRLGRGVGTAYLLANIGSIGGVIAASVYLLPIYGTAGATKLVATLNLLLGLAVLIYLKQWTVKRVYAAIGAVLTVAGFSIVLPTQIPFKGEFENETSKLLFWEEGDVATVKVVESQSGTRAMTIDGYIIGIDEKDNLVAHKQKLLAHFPPLLRPDAKHTLNIGLGSGSTLATLAGYSNLESLDCVEIVPGVVNGASKFEAFAKLNDPRVKVYVDDAVHFLLTSQKKYDIIIADGKQNPKFSGNAAVLSEEFHQYCLEHLTDDGVLIEWLSPAMHPSAFKAALRSFCNVYPEVAAYHFLPTSFAIIGSKKPIGNDCENWPRYFSEDIAKKDMATYCIENPMALLASRVTDGDRLRSLVKDVRSNTWDYPILEFIAYKKFQLSQRPTYVALNLELVGQGDIPQPASDTPGESLASKFIKSNRILRKGFIQMMRTRDAEVMRQVCIDARRVNSQDRFPLSVLSKIPGGYAAVIQPGKPHNQFPRK